MGYEFDRFDLETETVRRRSFIFNDFLPTMDISWGYNSGTSPHASFFWNEQFADVAFIAKGYDDVSRADIQDENFCSHINDLSLACRDSDPYSPLVDQRSAIVRTYEGNYFKIGYIGESSATANSLGKVEFRYEQL